MAQTVWTRLNTVYGRKEQTMKAFLKHFVLVFVMLAFVLSAVDADAARRKGKRKRWKRKAKVERVIKKRKKIVSEQQQETKKPKQEPQVVTPLPLAPPPAPPPPAAPETKEAAANDSLDGVQPKTVPVAKPVDPTILPSPETRPKPEPSSPTPAPDVELAPIPTETPVEGVSETVTPADTASSTEIFPVTASVEVGGVFPQLLSELGASVGFGVEVGYLLPVLEQRLQTYMEVTYIQPKHKDSKADPRLPDTGDYSFQITEQQLAFSIGALFRLFPPRSQFLNFYGQGGARLELQRSTVKGKAGSGFGSNEEFAAEVGGIAGGGVELALGPGALAAELDFMFADLNKNLTGNTSSGGILFVVGYHFLF